MDLVVPCAGQADCYVYTIRKGDVLLAIANFFGVDVAKIRQMNPGLGEGSTIGTGDKLKIPPPTK